MLFYSKSLNVMGHFKMNERIVKCIGHTIVMIVYKIQFTSILLSLACLRHMKCRLSISH